MGSKMLGYTTAYRAGGDSQLANRYASGGALVQFRDAVQRAHLAFRAGAHRKRVTATSRARRGVLPRWTFRQSRGAIGLQYASHVLRIAVDAGHEAESTVP